MPAYYASLVSAFISDDPQKIIGHLSVGVSDAGFEQSYNNQISAWQEQINILRDALTEIIQHNPTSKDWHLLLEYPIPRRGKRVDAILLAHNIIFVIEFKVGAKTYDSIACRQVEDYALDLCDFHAQSRHRVIIPFLVATHAPPFTCHCSSSDDPVFPTVLSNAQNLGEYIIEYFQCASDKNAEPIDPQAWNYSDYRPVPTIIEAAESLFAHQSVREISSSHAGFTNLTLTSNRLVDIVRSAYEKQYKAICFVTGIPGAGKTLTGLNVVHNSDGRMNDQSTAVFLSGNGPLVAIVREALALDAKAQSGKSLITTRHSASVFIQNVHSFLNTSLEQPNMPPHEHVVVFDEAQRAWTAEKQLRKFKRDKSEPAMMLSTMDRHLDWSVIIALVGGGQEIHDGEAGLAEWGIALQDYKHWQIYASPEVINGEIGLSGYRLFQNGTPTDMQIHTDPTLHLAVSIRSYKAEAVADWVNAVLDGKCTEAAHIASDIHQYPMALTRSLDTARKWLRDRTRGLRRCGLVASSEAKRLRPYGIEVSSQFRQGISYEQWFLYSHDDIRSSFQLEVAATEFDCQGLELDWVGVCWDNDMVFDSKCQQWVARRLSGNHWRVVQNTGNKLYSRNKYRVLLTRAREGFVIWVPPGDDSDETQSPESLDMTAKYLRQCGLQEI